MKGYKHDWTNSPSWYKYFAVDASGHGYEFMSKPDLNGNRWGAGIVASCSCRCVEYGYTGNWRSSLQAR